MPEEHHLHCTVCEDRVGVARIDSKARLVCHCTHTNGRISPVPVGPMELIPDSWEWREQDQAEDTKTPEEEWEEHNQTFGYEPPEDPPEVWSDQEYNELYDRVISKERHGFTCNRCASSPHATVEKARRHVESQHMGKLLQEVENRQGVNNAN